MSHEPELQLQPVRMPPRPPRPPAPPRLGGGGFGAGGGDRPRRPRPPSPSPPPPFNLTRFVREVRTELRRTSWPVRDEVTNWAAVALWVVLVTIALALLFDLFAAAALNWMRP
jgi:preprotein translocase SecE subunit